MIAAEVRLWGTRIGAVLQENLSTIPAFNYDQDFLASGIQLSPIMMPLNETIYFFPNLPIGTFHGLPGLLADSLPDKYGTALINSYLAAQGRDASSISAVERLLYTGTRGMGALEYYPDKSMGDIADHSLDIHALVQLASDILAQRENIHIRENTDTMRQIIKIGTSAGGARAKAIVAWNPATGDIRSGQINAGDGYEYWLIKFDQVENNKDKGDKADGVCYTRIEYAYYLMALACGIQMSECRLYREGDAYHFMTKRFDRQQDGSKLHMQSLGALAHFDFNSPGANSYEQAAQVMIHLGLGQNELKELYRRMVFNVMTRNQDDHVKNISFLMDKTGTWDLAPAYDVTYAYDPSNYWLSRHQMSIHGLLKGYTTEDLLAAGKTIGLSKTRAKNILDEVCSGVTKWKSFAEKAEIPENVAAEISRNHVFLI